MSSHLPPRPLDDLDDDEDFDEPELEEPSLDVDPVRPRSVPSQVPAIHTPHPNKSHLASRAAWVAPGHL